MQSMAFLSFAERIEGKQELAVGPMGYLVVVSLPAHMY